MAQRLSAGPLSAGCGPTDHSVGPGRPLRAVQAPGRPRHPPRGISPMSPSPPLPGRERRSGRGRLCNLLGALLPASGAVPPPNPLGQQPGETTRTPQALSLPAASRCGPLTPFGRSRRGVRFSWNMAPPPAGPWGRRQRPSGGGTSAEAQLLTDESGLDHPGHCRGNLSWGFWFVWGGLFVPRLWGRLGARLGTGPVPSSHSRSASQGLSGMEWNTEMNRPTPRFPPPRSGGRASDKTVWPRLNCERGAGRCRQVQESRRARCHQVPRGAAGCRRVPRGLCLGRDRKRPAG